MAAEIDPVVLEFFARTTAFEADLRRSTRTADQQLRLQERRVKTLENQFRSSSGAIATSIKGLAATLAAAFTGRELVGLIDSYTRLQNSLRVAGLEGEALTEVQGKLFDLAAKNGVAAGSLADLYSKGASAAGELGASQAQLLQLTENTALALRVSGVSAEQASGAILGLTQALSSGTVRAEEFNQVNEGGLRPLLQAAVATGRFGGSVAQLRNQIVDGKVSSKAFFDAVLEGSEVLRSQAAGSVLTISGAITSLNQRLTEYVGSNASATGATGLLSGAIESLAENIDTVVEALAVVAVAIGSRYVGALAVGIAQTATLGGAIAALGGAPVLAVGALVASVAILASRFGESERAAESARAAVEKQAEQLGILRGKTLEAAAANDTLDAKQRDILTGVANLTGEVDKLSTAWGRVAAAAKQAAIEQAQATLDTARAQETRLRATSPVRRKAFDSTARRPFAERGLGSQVLPTNPREAIAAADRAAAADPEQAEAERLAKATVREAQRALDEVRRRQLAGFKPAPITGTGDDPKKTKTPKGPKGPTDADRQNNFLDEQARLDAEILQSKIALADSVEDRARLEREFLTLQGNERRADIDAQVANKELTVEQGAALKAQIDALYGVAAKTNEQGELIATYNDGLISQELRLREQADLERQRLDVLDEQARAEINALLLQFNLADTEKDRRRIALQILDAEQRLALAREDEVLQSQVASKEAKELATLRRDAILAQSGGERASVERQFEGPLQRFARNTKDTDTRVAEAAVRRIEELNQTITDAMTNALGIKDPFLSQLIKIFLDKNVFGPLAEALSSQGGGGGDFLSSLVQIGASLFGRSSGGFVQAGRPYRVNEGSSPGRVEAFVPNTNGQIIPLGRMNAMQSGTGGGAGGIVKIVIEEGPGFASRVRTEATGVAIEVTRQAAPQIVDAAANETLRRASRPSL